MTSIALQLIAFGAVLLAAAGQCPNCPNCPGGRCPTQPPQRFGVYSSGFGPLLQSGFPPRSAADVHAHRCPDCGTVWSHSSASHGNQEAHTCPQCRRVLPLPWEQWHGQAAAPQPQAVAKADKPARPKLKPAAPSGGVQPQPSAPSLASAAPAPTPTAPAPSAPAVPAPQPTLPVAADLPPTGVITEKIHTPDGHNLFITTNKGRELSFADAEGLITGGLPDISKAIRLTAVGNAREQEEALQRIKGTLGEDNERLVTKAYAPDHWALKDLRSGQPLGFAVGVTAQEPDGRVIAHAPFADLPKLLAQVGPRVRSPHAPKPDDPPAPLPLPSEGTLRIGVLAVGLIAGLRALVKGQPAAVSA